MKLRIITLVTFGLLTLPRTGRAQTMDGWQWQPVAEARCGNGSTTGFGFRPAAAKSRKLVMFFQGGGACRSFTECYVLHTASRVTQGYDAARFTHDIPYIQELSITGSSGPFGAMHMAWVPYCTGDLHAGHRVYKEFNGRLTYHVGGSNVAADMAAIAAQVGPLEDVWLVGFSAGGFATVLNAVQAEAAFLGARLHVIDDSGLAFADTTRVPDRWGTAPFPADCAGCARNISLMLPWLAKTHPDGRFAYVSYTRDKILPLFFSTTELAFRQAAELFADTLDLMRLHNLAYFYVPARGHVVSQNADASVDNVRLTDWVWGLVDSVTDWLPQRAGPDVDDDTIDISGAGPVESVLDPEHGLPEPGSEEEL